MACVHLCLLELYELLNGFLGQHHLIGRPSALGMTSGQNPKLFLAFCATKSLNTQKSNSTGIITEVLKKGLPKFRCIVCKSEVSVHHGVAVYDPMVVRDNIPFFNSVDVNHRSNTKVFKLILSFANLLAVGQSLRSSLHTVLYFQKFTTFMTWHSYW